jgi:hypothetical protein
MRFPPGFESAPSLPQFGSEGGGNRRQFLRTTGQPQNLLLRQQLQVALRPKCRLPLRRRDRLFWLVVQRLRPDWRRYLLFVRPETVIRWHRRGWRWYWRWRSRTRLGRPRLSGEVRALIARRASENPLWGTERIRGELLKLGLVVSARSIRRYRRVRTARPPSQAWRTFLRNELAGIWAADLFVVQTLTFKTLYVLFFIQHQRRQLIHLNVTAHPTVAWVWQQLLNATPDGRHPAHLIHDRDGVYGADFAERIARMGIRSVRTPIRAPRANAAAERWVQSARREAVDRMLIFGEGHLRAVMTAVSAEPTHRLGADYECFTVRVRSTCTRWLGEAPLSCRRRRPRPGRSGPPPASRDGGGAC